MTIRHPVSFAVACAVIVLTATLTVALTTTHLFGLGLDVALVAALRVSAHREGRRS